MGGSSIFFFYFSFRGMGSTRSGSRLSKNHSASHEPSVAVSPRGVEGQGVHPRVSGKMRHLWVCSAHIVGRSSISASDVPYIVNNSSAADAAVSLGSNG